MTQYINDLKNGRDTAERVYLVRKSLWERASAAYAKAQMVESALKGSCDRIEMTDNSADTIGSTLIRAAKTGHKVLCNTDKARQSSELLSYELLDMLCQAEILAKDIEKFKIDVQIKLGKDKPIVGCVDEVLKTLPDISKHAKEGLNKILIVLKTIHDIEAAVADNCGINARLVGFANLFENCGMKGSLPKDEIPFITDYTCVTPPPDSMEDKECGTQYSTYEKTAKPDCGRNFKENFNKYRNNTKLAFEKAKNKSAAALAWLNCTAEQKNAAEANFNACKAAYDAAVAAKKC